nr:MAG TPA: hypothetical protein [Caudoviricetes sp.]
MAITCQLLWCIGAKRSLSVCLLFKPKRPSWPFLNAALCESMSRLQALTNAEQGIYRKEWYV